MRQARQLAAVVPYRMRNQRVEVAVITSVNGGDWIVPKGEIEEGERPWEAAAREAEEEAGLLGVVSPRPLGGFSTGNGNRRAIGVYAFHVSAVLRHWPEDRIRRRRWMSLQQAERCLRREFQPLIPALARRLSRQALRPIGPGRRTPGSTRSARAGSCQSPR